MPATGMSMEDTADFTLNEIKCVRLLPALPLWIIEYAWRWQVTDLLKVLGTPLWLEGDWRSLSLAEPCSVRAAAAEAWAVLKARDVEHYERVIEFLEVAHELLPQLVSCIKHMKIVFGFKTLVIMWMIRKGHCPVRTMEKTKKFFPTQLFQYHRCSQRHMDLMKRNSEEFREFAVFLASDEDSRQTYIRDLMDKQYGEQYVQKLEERLNHYLQQLKSALPQLTCLEQVLRREWPITEGEELLLDLLASSPINLPMALKRLLQCALVHGCSLPNTTSPACSQCTLQGDQRTIVSPITFMHSQQSTKPQTCCQIRCTGDGHRKSSQSQPSSSSVPQSARQTADTAPETRPKEEGGNENFDSPLLLEEVNSDEQNGDPSQRGGGGERGGLKGDWRTEEVGMEEMEQGGRDKIDRRKKSDEEEEEKEDREMERKREDLERMEGCQDSAEVMLVSGGRQMCSTHHKWMKSILQECSEELLSQGQLVSLTPSLPSDTPTPTPTFFGQVGKRGSLSHEDPLSLPTLSSTPKEAARSRGGSGGGGGSGSESGSGSSPRLGGASPICVLRISAETQRLLIRSPLLQPFVLLTRLPPQHRGMAREGESESQSEEWEEDVEEEEEEDGESVSFDVNSLFSDPSFGSDSDNSDNSDSDYVP